MIVACDYAGRLLTFRGDEAIQKHVADLHDYAIAFGTTFTNLLAKVLFRYYVYGSGLLACPYVCFPDLPRAVCSW